MADRERDTEVKTVSDLLDEIEDETLYLNWVGKFYPHPIARQKTAFIRWL